MGDKCNLTCHIGEKKKTEALWDTGAQVSVMSQEWLQQHHPQEKIQPIASLFPDGSLHLTAANNTTIPFLGYVELCVSLNSPRKAEIIVHFLVTTSNTNSHIILGYNVIAEVATNSHTSTKDVSAHMAAVLPHHPQPTVNAVIEIITTSDQTSA